MLAGLVLFHVGAVLCLNGLWLLGRISDREIVVIDVAVGAIALAVAAHDALGPVATPDSIRGAALTLLFAITYFWVAYNRLAAVDGRGLGWFSLFVALSLVPVSARMVAAASSPVELWLAMGWPVWAGLWFLYFLLLAMGWPIVRLAGWATLATGVATGWLPGLVVMGWL